LLVDLHALRWFFNRSVATVTGGLNLYDLPGGQLRRKYNFPAPLAYQRFSSDGRRLFVLTRDQTA